MLKRSEASKILHSISYCTKPQPKDKNFYSHTVLLPKTKFPLKLLGKKLTERDTNIYKLAAFDDLYQWQRTNLKNTKEFILHDGPPYANGRPHCGHAINKILKDIILRWNLLNNRKVHYVPGWDCHGLPIELKALSQSQDVDSIQIRQKARDFASNTINEQKTIFRSWGLIGDWNNHYETKNIHYVNNQLKQFFTLYETDYVYRDFKPVYWSPSSKTALAESELEYNQNHESPAVFLRLKVKEIPNVPNLKDKKVYVIVWTTTPWTLPSNQAISYNNSLTYCIIKKPDVKDDTLYIIATETFDSFCKEINQNYQLLGVHSGDMLKDATYIHPVYKEKTCHFFHSSHVTNLKGTGLVHTAPAHGPDDFLVAIKHQLPVIDLIDENGCYRSAAGELLQNKFVLTEGNETVINLLDKDIIHRNTFTHSYPYDWRTKQPVIIRASKQWFMKTEKIKNRALEVLENVEILPTTKSEIYKKIIINQLQNRPYWCISRQRKWGVPIPVFYERNNGNVLLNKETISHISKQLLKHDTDFWWKLPLKDLLPNNYSNNHTKYEKGEDILDIWFDSGLTWSYVLNGKQADLYLEGVDQFNGWFQTSLITSLALNNQAPYKAILVHGYAVDKDGIKMSKSLGNVIDPVDITQGHDNKKQPYGVDVLRWWVASHANQANLASIGDNILSESMEEIQKIRSTMRFCLGALFDYQPEEMNYDNLLLIDRYILHSLYQLYEKISHHMDNYHFHKLNTILLPFMVNQVSALYFSSIKDRLYCAAQTSPSRKSAQYTLHQILSIVSYLIGSVLPHLVEEMYKYIPYEHGGTTFFTENVQNKHWQRDMTHWKNENIEQVLELILKIRKEINQAAQQQQINSLELSVCVTFVAKEYNFLMDFIDHQSLENQMASICQVSQILINPPVQNEAERKIEIKTNTEQFNCPRCRLKQADYKNDLCFRCQNVVHQL